MTDHPEEEWIQVLKTLFLDIWLYILIIAIGILLFIGLLLGIWYSLFSDRSYKFKKKIRPASEIESASVFASSKVTQDDDRLPPYPRSHNQDLPPPVPSLLMSVRRSRQTCGIPKLRHHDDGYSSDSDEDRNSIGVERRRQDEETRRRQDEEREPQAMAINKEFTFSNLDHGIIETHKTLKHQRQTSTLERLAHRNNGRSSLPNRHNHTSHNDEVFVDRANRPMRGPDRSHVTETNQSKCNPSTLDGRDISVSPSSRGESSNNQLHHGNHDYRLSNHDNRLSSNIDNTVETRLPSNSNHHNSIKTKIRTNNNKISNSNVHTNLTVLNLPSQHSDSVNQGSDMKSYIITGQSYINNECNVHKNIHYNNIDQRDGIIYTNQAASNEEEDEDLYTDGFSSPLRPQVQDYVDIVRDDLIYQNHETNQQTYDSYDAQVYANNNYDAQVYVNNDSARIAEHNFGHLTRQSIYVNNDTMDDESTDDDDEFMDIEDISIYMNH